MALTQKKFDDLEQDIDDTGKFVNAKDVITPRYGDPFKSAPLIAQELAENGMFQPFSTEVELKTNVPSIVPTVAKALDTKKVWIYEQQVGESVPTWHDTGLSELDQAKEHTNQEVESLASKIALKKGEIDSKIPILVDNQNKILIGYDTETDQIEAVGLQEQVLDHFSTVRKSEDTQNIALLTDANNKILIGYDMIGDVAIIAGLDFVADSRPAVAEVNHFLFYGQSLSVGATATTILSETQPYSNLTFNTGPRLDAAATSVIPLVEQFNSPSSDGYTNRGETVCSGAANYASRAMMRKNVDPKKHVIFCSTAGHGGYRIDQLEKGTTWYNFLIKHVAEAQRLNVDKSYKVQVLGWVQGENDAINTQQTTYEVYKQKLLKLQKDVSADAKALTNQKDEVKFITYQMSYAAKTWNAQALVQLHLAQQSDKFALSTPIYHMPYAADNIHLTNIGYKWLGAYFGRAYEQLIADNRKPDFINPLSAKLDQNKVIIKFIVPKKPLVLDVTTLANTTNYGFKVIENSSDEIEITNVEAFDDEVHLTLASAPTSDLKVRYALDYLGSGLTVTNGASGNLRDSTTDSAEIAGVVKPLYHVCPHFELTAYLDKGI